MATIEERVKGIVVDRLNAAEGNVTAETSFVEDLDADSLDLVDLIQAFEAEFQVDGVPLQISDEDAGNIHTVRDAVAYIEARMARETADV